MNLCVWLCDCMLCENVCFYLSLWVAIFFVWIIIFFLCTDLFNLVSVVLVVVECFRTKTEYYEEKKKRKYLYAETPNSPSVEHILFLFADHWNDSYDMGPAVSTRVNCRFNCTLNHKKYDILTYTCVCTFLLSVHSLSNYLSHTATLEFSFHLCLIERTTPLALCTFLLFFSNPILLMYFQLPFISLSQLNKSNMGDSATVHVDARWDRIGMVMMK